MMMVLGAVALAAVLGLAMLASASLQLVAAHNASASLQADALAESGIDLACYYLIKPWNAPPFSGDYWAGATNLALGSGTGGSFDVSVAFASQDANGHLFYTITSTGKAADSNGGTIARTRTCTIQLTPGFRVNHGAAFRANDVTIPAGSELNCAVQGHGKITNKGIMDQDVWTPTWVNQGTFRGAAHAIQAADANDVPVASNLRDYTTYTYNGQSYNARALTQNTLAPGTVLQPTADNPAGIFTYQGQLTITQGVTIKGTLIVSDRLTINNGGNTITPQPGFPAAILQNNACLAHSTIATPQVTFNGLVWVHGQLNSTTSGLLTLIQNGSFNVNGALLMDDAGQIQWSNSKGKVYVTWNAANVGGVQLDKTLPPPSVVLLSYQ